MLSTTVRAGAVKGSYEVGGRRDVGAVAEMDLRGRARAITSVGSVRGKLGAVNVQVICAGLLVSPGVVICTDEDGVVVVARAQDDSVMDKVQVRLDGEEAKRQRLAAGEVGLDIYSMRKRLAESGLVYVDSLEELGDFNGIDCRGK